MFLLKKLLFKFMELGLGLRTCFSLETKDPIFVNFKLSAEEAARVADSLPPGFQLRKIRFCQSDAMPEYWISYNLYELKYPKPELQNIKKVRCEINTFVEDAQGRKGVFVFCGSPYVSKEKERSLMGIVCDFAERLVVFIYGCGGLTRLSYALTSDRVAIALQEGPNRISLDEPLARATDEERLSDDYWLYNDISFFNGGKTYDLVNVNSAFFAAKLTPLPSLKGIFEGPFFRRAPDAAYYHRGEIAYVVNSLNPAPAVAS